MATAYSDMGTRKTINQDGYFLKSGHFGDKLVCLAAICDGMGGFDLGEQASNFVIGALDEWFKSKLVSIIKNGFKKEILDESMNEFLITMNSNLIDYGLKRNIKLGTTCSILLIIGSECFVYHIGDSRIYYQSQNSLNLLTEDQTLAVLRLKKGEITIEEAKKSKEKNILLQCVGIKNDVVPYKLGIEITNNDSFLLCSDGFYHCLESLDVKEILLASTIQEANEMLQRAIQKVRFYGETDDVTAVVMKLVND